MLVTVDVCEVGARNLSRFCLIELLKSPICSTKVKNLNKL